MRYLKDQCKQCPFRKTSMPGWLGGYVVGGIFRSIWHGEPFFCHTAIEGPDGFGYEDKNWLEKAMKNGKLCVGGLAFAEKMFAPSSSHAQINFGRAKVSERNDVECMNPQEFGKHHDPLLRTVGADLVKPRKALKGKRK